LHYLGIGLQTEWAIRFAASSVKTSVEVSDLSILLTCLLFQDMVVLPYKDSLLLLSRYLQQLVMESLGKEFDLDGNRVFILASLLPAPDAL
jgi:hypothetical protein